MTIYELLFDHSSATTTAATVTLLLLPSYELIIKGVADLGTYGTTRRSGIERHTKGGPYRKANGINGYIKWGRAV